MIPTGDEKFPIIDGCYDSLVTTANQDELIGILKGLGKMALVVGNSKARGRTEKLGGLESFTYQLEQKVLRKEKLTPKVIEELENEVRFEDFNKAIGNTTEIYRTLLRGALADKNFQEILQKVIAEQVMLEKKASQNRQLAHSSKNKDYLN